MVEWVRMESFVSECGSSLSRSIPEVERTIEVLPLISGILTLLEEDVLKLVASWHITLRTFETFFVFYFEVLRQVLSDTHVISSGNDIFFSFRFDECKTVERFWSSLFFFAQVFLLKIFRRGIFTAFLFPWIVACFEEFTIFFGLVSFCFKRNLGVHQRAYCPVVCARGYWVTVRFRNLGDPHAVFSVGSPRAQSSY